MQEKAFRRLTPLDPGMFGYSWVRSGQDSELMRDIMQSMRDFDIELEGLHTETGPGVYDMKGALAAMMYAVHDLNLLGCDATVELLIVPDEEQEHGALTGAELLIEASGTRFELRTPIQSASVQVAYSIPSGPKARREPKCRPPS